MRASCPLCGGTEHGPSWMGSTWYADRVFDYRECAKCRSLFCAPMPDEATLARMYGLDYAKSFTHDAGITDPKQPERVVEFLRARTPATFLDYGCGQGGLLKAAQQVGWRAVGVEFSPDVVAKVAAETGATVVTDVAKLPEGGRGIADVLHLGDVLEHLTEMERQMPEILSLIKPGGYLLAQGPLEANGNLFTATLKAARKLGGQKRVQMAPYHVMLATAEGQRALFRRFGLAEEVFELREVAWPAPDSLSPGDFKRPRLLALFTLRKASQAVSRLQAGRWGNRYFYAGRRDG